MNNPVVPVFVVFGAEFGATKVAFMAGGNAFVYFLSLVYSPSVVKGKNMCFT